MSSRGPAGIASWSRATGTSGSPTGRSPCGWAPLPRADLQLVIEVAARGHLTRVPAHAGLDGARDHALAVAVDRHQQRLHELIAQVVRVQPQVEQLAVDRVVVVVLRLHARVNALLDRYVVPDRAPRVGNQLRQLAH